MSQNCARPFIPEVNARDDRIECPSKLVAEGNPAGKPRSPDLFKCDEMPLPLGCRFEAASGHVTSDGALMLNAGSTTSPPASATAPGSNPTQAGPPSTSSTPTGHLDNSGCHRPGQTRTWPLGLCHSAICRSRPSAAPTSRPGSRRPPRMGADHAWLFTVGDGPIYDTTSPGAGEPRAQPPSCLTSGCTTSGTSTRRVSLQRAAMSSPSNEPWATPPRPRH